MEREDLERIIETIGTKGIPMIELRGMDFKLCKIGQRDFMVNVIDEWAVVYEREGYTDKYSFHANYKREKWQKK